ncbi:MAG: 6-bladed beta-propeller, partial [Candidatus Aminicenantes bacterium]|nr:6-bladed beta-propeller [Candidatus Aminicenantes bacterium]
MKKTYYLFVVGVCFFLFAAAFPQKANWKGSFKEIEGIVVVKNPNKPIYSNEIVFFEEELSIGKPDGPEEYILNHILSFSADDEGNIFILDMKPFNVKVYDKEGKFLRSIGREGQGPGEFQSPENIQLTNQNELMVCDSDRGAILFFSVGGQFLREIKSQLLILAGYTLFDSQGNIYLNKFDFRERVGKLIKLPHPYESSEDITSLPDPAKRVVPPPQIRFALLPEGNMVWGISTHYVFYILDSSGRIIRKIEKESPALRMTEDYRKQYFERLPPAIPKESQIFSPSFPSFDQFFADGQGRLFVKSYQKLKGTNKNIIDVFDPEGRFLCQTALKVGDEISLDQDKFFIKNNKLYSGETDE